MKGEGERERKKERKKERKRERERMRGGRDQVMVVISTEKN